MNLLGVFFALASALVWGGGDFSGGIASRRSHVFQVLALVTLSGLAVMVVFAVLAREPFPAGGGIWLSVLAGVAGAVGLAALYQGLAIGTAAVVAPTSAVLSAAIPVVYAALTHGAPEPVQVAGFAFALLGIFLVSRSSGSAEGARQPGFLLGVLAGVGFGAFFILIAQASTGLVFTPLIVARVVEFLVAAVMLAAGRMRIPSPRANPIALLAGVLDSGGNMLYVLAGQFVRLDVAAVIASLYPATTVVLSSLILKQKVSRRQQAGVAFCLAAIALITL